MKKNEINKSRRSFLELFTEDADFEMHGVHLAGKASVRKLFMEAYKNRKISTLHTAHRRDQSQKQDMVSVSGDRSRASAGFYTQALICNPIRGQSVLADMARQQEMTAHSYWENGRYDITFAHTRDQWRISKMSYQKV